MAADGGHRRRVFVYRLAVLAFVIISQEILCRLVFPLPEVIGFNRIYYQPLATWDARSKLILQRGLVYDRLRFESQPDGFSEVHRLNRYGFRGSDFAILPSKGRRRILMIGDSIVAGQGAPEAATIPSVFTDLARNDGITAETLNLGVIATSLCEVTRLARDAVALLKPTDVIVVVYANDLPAPTYSSTFDEAAADFRRSSGLWIPRMLEVFARLAGNEPIHRRWPPHPVTPYFLPVPDLTNPWTRQKDRPPGLDPVLYQAMRAGKLNPWLWEQSQQIPAMLSYDFRRRGGTPIYYLARIASACEADSAHLLVAYVPFCGVTSGRYAPALVKTGMEPTLAEALPSDPIYRRQNELLASVCRVLHLPLADTTDALVAGEAARTPQYWTYDTHPRPAGYATIARHIYRVWRESLDAS